MKNKGLIFSIFLVFIIVFSVSAISAQDVDNAISTSEDETVIGDSEQVSGTVSGDVDVATENPWSTRGELSYDIPADAKTIKSADVYVNVYSGSAQNTYGANANISISTANGNASYSESLWTEDGSADGTVYTVNNHTTKCYSDFMVHYDVTSLIQGLNGTNLKIKVDTFKMENKSFDGKIKLIGLVLAYDDGDDDVINYLVDDNQIWTSSNKTISFNTASFNNVFEAKLINIALSSSDGTYKLNDEFLTDSKHKAGNYYQYNEWNITNYYKNGKNTELFVIPGQGWSGPSYKSVLSVLAAKSIINSAAISNFKVVDNSKDVVYPGFANKLTVTVNTNKAGKYVVVLLDNGTVVNSTEVDLASGDKTLTLIDPTIRPLTDHIKYDGSGNYDTVNYQIQVLFEGFLLNETSYEATVLYNGYLGKDTYNQTSLEFFYKATITGDMVILTNGTYATGTTKYALTSFPVVLSQNDTLVKAFIYVTYTYGGTNDNINMFNVTLNNNRLTPVFFSRDASNLKANSGSGVVVFDVSDYLVNGDNVLDLNKTGSAGVYPTTLVYMYNTTGSNVEKDVYIYNGADLLGSYGGLTNPIRVDSTIDVDSSDAKEATAYIFANGAVDGRGTVVINGENETHPWSGSSQSTDLYTKDITSTIKDKNDVSVIFSGASGSFTALQQIIVISKDAVDASASAKVADNSKDVVYPGFDNKLTVTVNTNRAGKYVVVLLDNGTVVNSTEVDLANGTTAVPLVDPTIRPLTDHIKYDGSGNYDTVNYQVQLFLNDKLITETSYEATVLYNGYLGKDTYNQTSLEFFYKATITGDMVILTNGTYATGTTKYALTSFPVVLSQNDTLVKAFIYVTYTYGGTNDNINMFNVTLNNNRLTPVFFSRDASNLKANSGSGVVVFDVSDYLVNGDNVLDLNKTGSAGVYPTTLVYMYNTTGSNVEKDVYIYNGADLLGSYGGLTNPIRVDSAIDVDSANINNAVAYIFANGAVDGRGTVVINGESEAHPWNGSSQSTDLYTKDITATVKDKNDVSVIFSGVSGSFTALQQIIVVTKTKETPAVKNATKITAPSVTKVYNVAKKLVATLKDSNGKALSGVKVTINLNGKNYVRTTNDKGQVSLTLPNLAPKTYVATVKFAGNDNYKESSVKSKVAVKKATPKMAAKTKVTYKVKTKTKKYSIVLKTNKNKVMKKVKVTLKVKGKTYKATTNSKGKATFKITKLTKRGKYTAKVKFAGNKYYNALTKTVKITVKK